MPLFLGKAAMNRARLNPLQEQILVNVINIGFVLAENQHRRRRLLQAMQEVEELRFLLDVLYLLDNVQVRGAGATDVHHARVHECRGREILDLLWHRCAE